MNFLEIDYSKLREQKEFLLNLRGKFTPQAKEVESVDGLVHLIDALQDYSVDEKGVDEAKVFGITEDAGITPKMLSGAHNLLVIDDCSIEEQVLEIMEGSEVDEHSMIDYLPKVQVCEAFEFTFTCKAFLEFIK